MSEYVTDWRVISVSLPKVIEAAAHLLVPEESVTELTAKLGKPAIPTAVQAVAALQA